MLLSPTNKKILKVAARDSLLSQAQVEEVEKDLQAFYKDISFEKVLVKTRGDLDLKTSLKTLCKTDFFTKEVDDLVLEGKCHLAIHSAKDLPEILDENLRIAAITKGQDPGDSLVLKEGFSWHTLHQKARIGVSSLRREENLQKLRSDWVFVDIRGSVLERLKLIEEGVLEGVVVAEAALIRLQLQHLNKMRLEGQTTPLQGQLAIVVRKEDRELLELFSILDIRSL